MDLTDEQWDDPNLIGMARMYRDTFHDGPCRYDDEGECIGCGRVRTTGPTPESDAWLTWHQWRQWEDGSWGAQRPRDIVDPCGGCGRAKAEHPIPNVKSYKGEEIARWILTLVDVAKAAANFLECGFPGAGRYEAAAQRLADTLAALEPDRADIRAVSQTLADEYRRLADEYREAIELARRIVAAPLEYGENRLALALVAIDEAMRSVLTNDR